MSKKLIADWRKRLARPASVATHGRLSRDPFASCFGRIAVQEPGEGWPTYRKKLMRPLLQINCAELPFRPKSIVDLAMIRVWIGEDFEAEPPGSTKFWCVRASPSIARLKPTPEPAHKSDIKPAGIRWKLLEADYPTWDEAPVDEIPEVLHESYHDHFACALGTKVGGWPHTVQSEVCWEAGGKNSTSAEFVFQIDSEPDLNWMWGDAGLGYVGRGSGKHRKAWRFDWQCC